MPLVYTRNRNASSLLRGNDWPVVPLVLAARSGRPCQSFVSAVLSAGGSSLMRFALFSEVAWSHQMCSKQAKNEINSYAWDLTRMDS